MIEIDDRKPRPQLFDAWPALLFAFAAACSCGDRQVGDQGPTAEEMAAQAHQLCTEIVQWQTRCFQENDLPPDELNEEQRHALCMDDYFPKDLGDQCWDEAVLAASCEPTQGCENLPYTNDSPWPCRATSNVFGACKSNPEYWNEHGCDASKCPGECCVHAND